MPSNENSTFHNILELVFHEFVKHEGHLKVKLLTKMHNSDNMKKNIYIYIYIYKVKIQILNHKTKMITSPKL